MAKIYTRTGDDGTTGLQGGRRVKKSDPIVHALGELDALNAALGWAAVSVTNTRCRTALTAIQSDLLRIGAALSGDGTGGPDTSAVADLERMIDTLESGLPPLQQFILPAGCESATRLHWVRTICRRAERHVQALQQAGVDEAVRHLNRVSDLLFVMAREANRTEGVGDVPWEA